MSKYRKIPFVLSIAIAAIGSNCHQSRLPSEERQQLVGVYHLVINSRSADRRLKSSELTLGADSSLTLHCHYNDGPDDNRTGTWSYLGNGKLSLSQFKDCAKVFGAEGYEGGIVLTVELNERPVAIINPDIPSVFYERLP